MLDVVFLLPLRCRAQPPVLNPTAMWLRLGARWVGGWVLIAGFSGARGWVGGSVLRVFSRFYSGGPAKKLNPGKKPSFLQGIKT